MRCGEGIKLFTSSVMWAVWIEEESHETKVQFRPLAVYHIFRNTDTYSPFCLCQRGSIASKAFKKNFWKKYFRKKILTIKFWQKNCRKKNFGKKMLEKKFSKKIRKKKFSEK